MSSQKYEKSSDKELKKKLDSIQYKVTQENATETAFDNKYWDSHKEGIYVDITTGEPLFSSEDKFDSESGWPSFSKPIDSNCVYTKEDCSSNMTRTEARSNIGDAHLGHVFHDGPRPTQMRYCINSASLQFIPKSQLKFETAYLAGGCFWGMQKLLDKVPGVIKTQVGYMSQAETVKIMFDPKKLSYQSLVQNIFFKIHNPTTLNQQGNDIGSKYRSAIFYVSKDQKSIANKIKQEIQTSKLWKNSVVTQINQAEDFILAENFHQKYLEKNPEGYTCHYFRSHAKSLNR